MDSVWKAVWSLSSSQKIVGVVSGLAWLHFGKVNLALLASALLKVVAVIFMHFVRYFRFHSIVSVLSQVLKGRSRASAQVPSFLYSFSWCPFFLVSVASNVLWRTFVSFRVLSMVKKGFNFWCCFIEVSNTKRFSVFAITSADGNIFPSFLQNRSVKRNAAKIAKTFCYESFHRFSRGFQYFVGRKWVSLSCSFICSTTILIDFKWDGCGFC